MKYCVIIELMKGSVEAGEEITLTYSNTTSPWLANQVPGESDHEGLVLVMIDGKKIEPSPAYRVEPGAAVQSRVIIPSSARPGEPFRVQIVSLDAFNNLSGSEFEAADITCNGKALARMPAYTGRTEVEVALPEKGIHRLEVNGTLSNPIRICDSPSGPYWGDMHCHNYPSVDAMGNTPYKYARKVSCLDFAAAAEHHAVGLKEHWAQIRKWCREWNDPGRFVTILAIETNTGWHHNFYFYENDLPVIDSLKERGSHASVNQIIIEYTRDKKVLTQIHHSGWGFDMRLRYPDTTRFFEIYSMHGSSEFYDPDSSLFMSKCRNRSGDAKVGPYYARDAWALGQRFITHGSSDNHFGQAGVRHNSVTAVNAPELTREAILDTMAAGRCYATTGERILLDFSINGHPMGHEFQARRGDTLAFSVEVNGTGPLESVEVFACAFIEGNRDVPVGELMFDEDDPDVENIRQGWEAVLQKNGINKLDTSHTWDIQYDGEPLVCYVRVIQRDLLTLPGILEGQKTPQKRAVMAWSTPIWVTPC